jgi:hypothetical protein
VIGIRYPPAPSERYTRQLKKGDLVLSNAAAKIVIEEARVIHGLTEHIMTLYRADHVNEFEVSQHEIDQAPVI